jgi:hypothetical protein
MNREKYARVPGTNTWLPLDGPYWRHEAEALRLRHQLEALGWEFWS